VEDANEGKPTTTAGLHYDLLVLPEKQFYYYRHVPLPRSSPFFTRDGLA
jgi:hypothetical protein